jgi:hypothetical protein
MPEQRKPSGMCGVANSTDVLSAVFCLMLFKKASRAEHRITKPAVPHVDCKENKSFYLVESFLLFTELLESVVEAGMII